MPDNPELDQELINAILGEGQEEAPGISSKIPANFETNRALHYAHKILKGAGGGKFTYCIEEDYFYIYENGIWRKIFDIEFLSKISVKIPEITQFSLQIRKQILDNFKIIAFKNLRDFNFTNLLTLENIMLDPLAGHSLAHDFSYYSTIKLDYKYSPTIKCELWLKTLGEIFENVQAKINTLQEFFGYCLTRETKHRKALLLLGESNCGKSTILNILRLMTSPKNCSAVPLKYISNPQYTPMLINKLVNIDADVSQKAEQFEAEFKIITSGEPISCNQKFVATFEFVPFCKIVLAANIFPKITDHSSAFYNRLILIPCDRVFNEEEQNKNLVRELEKELPGILNWAMAGLQRLNKRGMFERTGFMTEAIAELEDENNPSNVFFNDHVEIDMSRDAYIEKAELFDKYKKWCDDNKQYSLSHIRFAICVFKKFSKVTPKSVRHNDGKRPWIWKHLRFVHNKGNTPAQEAIEVTWQDRPGYTV